MKKKSLPITEYLNETLPFIDEVSALEGIDLLLNDQYLAVLSLEKKKNDILKVIEAIHNKLKDNKSGRLIYAGAGTSGRICVQDGVELNPTFGWPRSKVEFIIAGGKKSLLKSIENAEDDEIKASKEVERLNVNEKDILIGVAASGTTPFTSRVLKDASNKRALTVDISNNPYGKILENCTYKIILETNEEMIAGSTRLKAGTSQKICLNLISSMLMIKLGKVKKGRMISLVANNKKLKLRKESIFQYL